MRGINHEVGHDAAGRVERGGAGIKTMVFWGVPETPPDAIVLIVPLPLKFTVPSTPLPEIASDWPFSAVVPPRLNVCPVPTLHVWAPVSVIGALIAPLALTVMPLVLIHKGPVPATV